MQRECNFTEKHANWFLDSSSVLEFDVEVLCGLVHF